MSHHKVLHRTYKTVASLEPLDPGASPASKAEFRKTAKLYRQYIGQMFTHIIGICEASEISSEDDEILEPLEEPAPTSRSESASRYEEIQALVAEGSQLGAPDVLAHLFNAHATKPTQKQAEDQAFVRLLLGYEITETVEEIVSRLFP